MLTETKRTDLFCEYYAKWITVYKKGAIRKVTMDKYLMTQKWLVKLVPNLRVCDMNRIAYQQLLNDYGVPRAPNHDGFSPPAQGSYS